MPSAEETTYLIEVVPEAGHHRHRGQEPGFTSRDVDVLVSRIKENLRLSGFKSRSSLAGHKMRASPYRLPSSWPDASGCELCSGPGSTDDPEHRHHHQQHYRRYRKQQQQQQQQPSALELDDSYERFQALLRNGALIKEAVKRLQTNPDAVDVELEVDVDESGAGAVGKGRTTSTSATSTTLDSMDEEDEDEELLYRRKRFYYDSEDEPLPSVYQPLEL